MRNLKKLLSVLVAVAMIAALMVPAFAAPSDVSADVSDAKVKAAVERLAAFGIVNGKEDGKYHPEENITRDAFAKLVVEAMGIGSAAIQGPTQFKDVPADRWSSGYINVAVGAGIIKGRPDGTFGPLDNVTYAEAVTMLVRALGYKDSFLKGTWPGNYLAKAAELNITKGVKVSPSGVADRGAVAVMLNNTLDAKVIKQTSYGDENTWSDKDQPTLLEDKLSITKIEKAVVTGTPKVDSGIDADQIKIGDDTYDVAADFIDIDSWLGLNVNAYLNDDDEVVYIEESATPYKVVYDVIDAGEDVNKDSITLVNADKEYKFESASAPVYIDNKEADIDDLAEVVNDADKDKSSKDKAVFGKFVINNKGSIALADVMVFDSDRARIVTSVDTGKARIIYNVSAADDEKVLKLDEDTFDKVVIMDASGKAMSLKDVKKDDIIYVNSKVNKFTKPNDATDGDLKIASSGDTVCYVVVVRNTVEGEATSYNSDEVEIGGKAYDWSAEAVTVSIDNDDGYSLKESSDFVKNMDDITDQEASVLALLDLVGKVRHIRTDIEASSGDMYGIITGKELKYRSTYVTILNYDEEEVEYKLDVDTNTNLSDNKYYTTSGSNKGKFIVDNVNERDVVRYTIDKDGNIDKIEFIASLPATSPLNPNLGDGSIGISGTVSGDFGTDYAKVITDGETKKLIVSDDVKILNAYEGLDGTTFNPEDSTFVKWDDIKDKSSGGPDVVYVTNDNSEIVFMLFYDGQLKGASDEQAGYILSSRKKSGDTVVDIVLPGGETSRYTVKGVAADVYAAKQTIVVFEVRSDGKIDIVTDDSDDCDVYLGANVTKISGKFVTLDNDNNSSNGNIGTFKVASDAIFYEEDDVKSYSDIDVGDVLDVIVKDGSIKVVKIK